MSILQEHIEIKDLEVAGFTKRKPNGSVSWFEGWTKIINGYTIEINIYDNIFFINISWRDVTSHSRIEYIMVPAEFDIIRKTILCMTDGGVDIMKLQ